MSDRATSAPFPSTPVGKQGAIPIATRVEPPAVASRVAEDFIVYPHHLVFSVVPKNESHHAWKTGMPLTARQARVGEAARSMCNFRMFGDTSTATSIKNDYNIRFLGVSYEGTPDYRAAQALDRQPRSRSCVLFEQHALRASSVRDHLGRRGDCALLQLHAYWRQPDGDVCAMVRLRS